MTEQLENSTPDEIQDIADEITGTMEQAYDSLLASREAAFAAETEPLDAEEQLLRQEQADIADASGNLEKLLPAQQREAQRQADAALLAGKLEEAEAKREEYEEARTAPEAMKKRQREIAARIEAIADEKKAIARRCFEQWYAELQRIVRAAERGLFIKLLDKAHDELFAYQASHGLQGSPLLTANLSTGLTADEHSIEWKSGTNWYSGRRAGR